MMKNGACRFVYVVFLTLGATTAAAGGRIVGGTYLGPVWPGYRFPMYLYPCPPNRACEDRWQPRRPVAPEQPSFAEQDIWGTNGSPWGYVRRLPPPTPDSHIQPRYRDASTIRPEFAEPTDLPSR
jgi:hypothetical protein